MLHKSQTGLNISVRFHSLLPRLVVLTEHSAAKPCPAPAPPQQNVNFPPQPLTSNLHHPSITSAFDQENLKFCDDILCKVSRSFAAVIRQLPPPMLVDVMIFYLVLRALDTVEDDMTAFASNKVKIDHLSSFHKTALGDPNWSMDGVGEADER